MQRQKHMEADRSWEHTGKKRVGSCLCHVLTAPFSYMRVLTRVGEMRHAYIFSENVKRRDNWENIGVDDRTILKTS
jgi:hypothetical protein